MIRRNIYWRVSVKLWLYYSNRNFQLHSSAAYCYIRYLGIFISVWDELQFHDSIYIKQYNLYDMHNWKKQNNNATHHNLNGYGQGNGRNCKTFQFLGRHISFFFMYTQGWIQTSATSFRKLVRNLKERKIIFTYYSFSC